MDAAGLTASGNPVIARKIDLLVTRLRRRQLVGSHSVAIETVNLFREVVEVCKITSFEGLLEALGELGRKLQNAGRKEPVINNVLLRILKFLREEYHTALQSAFSTSSFNASSPPSQSAQQTSPTSSSLPQMTPGSLVSTPFAAYPLDTSASFGFPGGSLKRQDSHFPFEYDSFGSGRRIGNMSTDSLSTHIHSYPSTSQSAIGAAHQQQTLGTGSMFELLGHQPNRRDPLASEVLRSSPSTTSMAGTSGTTTPLNSTGPAGTPFDSPALHMSSLSHASSSVPLVHRSPSKPPQSSLASQHTQHQHPALILANKLEADFSKKASNLRPVFVDAITELLEELAINRDQISAQAMDHIHSAEIILTIGYSQTVEAFLKAASRKRRITVVVAETAPSYLGRTLALSLSSSNIQTLLIPDSGIFSLLSRVSKVILGTHSVRADGSLVAITGTLPLVKAAKEQKVPVIVLAGMFKVSPDFGFHYARDEGEAGHGLSGYEEDEYDYGNPGEVLRLSDLSLEYAQDGEDTEDADLDQKELLNSKVDIEIVAPYYDKVPAEFVDLFITNIGAHPTSMIFRLLKELFE